MEKNVLKYIGLYKNMFYTCYMSNLDSSLDEAQSLNFEEEEEEEVAQMISWLKENAEPQDKVAEFMAKTAEKRKRFIHELQASLSDIIEEFPRILDKGMVRLFVCFAERETKSLYKDVESLHRSVFINM